MQPDLTPLQAASVNVLVFTLLGLLTIVLYWLTQLAPIAWRAVRAWWRRVMSPRLLSDAWSRDAARRRARALGIEAAPPSSSGRDAA